MKKIMMVGKIGCGKTTLGPETHRGAGLLQKDPVDSGHRG